MVLSFWLRRHAAYCAVSEAAPIAWLGLRVSNLRTVDLSQSLGDHLGPAIAMHMQKDALGEHGVHQRLDHPKAVDPPGYLQN